MIFNIMKRENPFLKYLTCLKKLFKQDLILLLFIPIFITYIPLYGNIEFPGENPGNASAEINGELLILKNNIIEVIWSTKSGGLALISAKDLVKETKLNFGDSAFILDWGNVTNKSIEMKLSGSPSIMDLQPDTNSTRASRKLPGKQIILNLVDVKNTMKIEWRGLLYNSMNYVRQEISIKSKTDDKKLNVISLLEAKLTKPKKIGNTKGSILTAGNIFFGMENPMALNISDRDTGKVSCTYSARITLKKEISYIYSLVIGVYPEGQMRRGFLYYLENERIVPYRQFLHYNSWFDINRPDRQQLHVEQDILESINDIGTELVQKRGVALESFIVDDAWDNLDSLWEFHRTFPDGFDNCVIEAKKYQSGLGVWLSPFGGYGKQRKRRQIGAFNKGITKNKNSKLSMGNENYARIFEDACFNMLRKYNVNHFKFDGLGTGKDGAAIKRMLDLIGKLRIEKKDLWINATVGTWGSPFWTLYADSIWRGGHDVNYSGVGNMREKWITYRDNTTYKNLVIKTPLYPLNSIMFHGVVISPHVAPGKMPRDEESIRNEIRCAFGCGSGLQELYISPEVMTPQMWDDIAESAKWARANTDVLVDTHWIGGKPNALQVYGWASWNSRKGILCLRNPDQKSKSFNIDLAKLFELPENAPKKYHLQSPYKDQSIQSVHIEAGKTHEVNLEPFEVLVFDAIPEQ